MNKHLQALRDSLKAALETGASGPHQHLHAALQHLDAFEAEMKHYWRFNFSALRFNFSAPSNEPNPVTDQQSSKDQTK